MTNFDQHWAEAKTFGILQKKEEMRRFMKFISHKHNSFLEIGTAGGGVASILLRQFAEGYSIDMLPCWNLHRLKEINPNFHQYVNLSWAGMTLYYFEQLNKQFDLLFIDGAHDLNSAMRDYMAYKNFVRPGGIIAFHDILFDNKIFLGESVNVKPLWELLKGHHQWHEFISDDSTDCDELLKPFHPLEWGGIGCIIV
jgi:predicted O-methyltransferase YrrM